MEEKLIDLKIYIEIYCVWQKCLTVYPLQGKKKRAAPVRDLKEYYSESLLEMVTTVYAREIKLFGYVEQIGKKNNILVGNVSDRTVEYNYLTDELKL